MGVSFFVGAAGFFSQISKSVQFCVRTSTRGVMECDVALFRRIRPYLEDRESKAQVEQSATGHISSWQNDC